MSETEWMNVQVYVLVNICGVIYYWSLPLSFKVLVIQSFKYWFKFIEGGKYPMSNI